MKRLRPYRAAFAARFQLMLQYRAAALAGFATQCWWGGLKVMVFAAFYGASAGGAAAAPIALSQVITYTWTAQGLLALLPWQPDPDVVAGVRTGGVTYDRLRPVDAYAYWYVRSAAWMAARAVPRVALMAAFAGLALPLIGLADWSWKPPAGLEAAILFPVSLALALMLGAAVMMLINIVVAATLNDRGVTILFAPVLIVLSGNLMPLPLYPDAVQGLLLFQPFAGILDIPCRIYMGHLTGPDAWLGLGLQAFWSLFAMLIGRLWMERTMQRLEVQGG